MAIPRRSFFSTLAAGIAGLFVGRGLKGAGEILTPPEFTMEDYEEEWVTWEDRNTWGSMEITPPLHIKD